MSWIIGRSAGSTQPSLGRVSLSLHSYQNPQFGMTINKFPPLPTPPLAKQFTGLFCSAESQGARESSPLLEIKDFGPPARGGHFVLFHSFLPPSAIRHAVSHGSFFAGSTSVPSPPPRR